MSHFSLVKSTSTSHTWIDIVNTKHKKKDIFLRIFHSEKPQLAPSFEPVTFQPRSSLNVRTILMAPSMEQSWHSFLFLARHHKFLNFYLVQFRKKANTIKVRQTFRFCTLMMIKANWGQCYKASRIRKNGCAVIFNWPVGVHIKLLKLLYSFVRV